MNHYYKTKEENVFATIVGEETHYFTPYATVLIAQGTEKIQSDGGLIEDPEDKKKIAAVFRKIKDTHLIEQRDGMQFFINRKNYSISVLLGDKMIPIDKAEDKMTILGEKQKMNDFLKGIKKSKENYMLGDRVLIYGPTGTGKTYEIIEFLKVAKIEHRIIPITEGMEDIDFFNRIIPGPKGVEYKQKEICDLLDRAEKGEKVCIVLDELNRGSNSLMNLILKALDPVDGENYYITDIIQDRTYVVPQENLLWAGTVNLGGKYTGTNALDEALLDRFNIIKNKGYNLEVEKAIISSVVTDKPNVKKIQQFVEEIRAFHSAGEIRAPISTRGVKMWMELYLNSGDLVQSFRRSILFRLCTVDDYGNPNSEELDILMGKFKEIIS